MTRIEFTVEGSAQVSDVSVTLAIAGRPDTAQYDRVLIAMLAEKVETEIAACLTTLQDRLKQTNTQVTSPDSSTPPTPQSAPQASSPDGRA